MELEMWRCVTSDTEMQSLEFAQLVFCLALVQYFLCSLSYALEWCHCMLEIYDLLLDVDFIGNYS